jgi:hypothetical protein
MIERGEGVEELTLLVFVEPTLLFHNANAAFNFSRVPGLKSISSVANDSRTAATVTRPLPQSNPID